MIRICYCRFFIFILVFILSYFCLSYVLLCYRFFYVKSKAHILTLFVGPAQPILQADFRPNWHQTRPLLSVPSLAAWPALPSHGLRCMALFFPCQRILLWQLLVQMSSSSSTEPIVHHASYSSLSPSRPDCHFYLSVCLGTPAAPIKSYCRNLLLLSNQLEPSYGTPAPRATFLA